MFVLVLNQSNLVQDGQNNKLVYRFPNSVNLTNKYIAVSQINMYYSWFNITSGFANNTLSYTWTDGTVLTTFQIVIPDGLYEVTEINSYCQFQMVSNGTFWSSTGSNYKDIMWQHTYFFNLHARYNSCFDNYDNKRKHCKVRAVRSF